MLLLLFERNTSHSIVRRDTANTEKFITKKVQTDDLQRISVMTGDNVLMHVDATVCWMMGSKATSADEVPTPGYMYNEIARITHASAAASKQLEEYLIKRLTQELDAARHKVTLLIDQVETLFGEPVVGARLAACAPALAALLAGRTPCDLDRLRRNVAMHAVADGVDVGTAGLGELRAAQRKVRLGAGPLPDEVVRAGIVEEVGAYVDELFDAFVVVPVVHESAFVEAAVPVAVNTERGCGGATSTTSSSSSSRCALRTCSCKWAFDRASLPRARASASVNPSMSHAGSFFTSLSKP